jgi:hypothetical protein
MPNNASSPKLELANWLKEQAKARGGTGEV